MQLFLTQFLARTIFVIAMAILFIRCGSDDPAREAAKDAALKNTNQPAITPPADDTAPARPQEVGQLPLQVSNVRGPKGSEACLSVTTSQFNGIVSMQYTMKWDPAVLKYKDVKNFGLPGMASTNFGARAADQGILAYSWFDANVQGITQPDGTKLYDVCFEVIGESGSSSTFEFADAPVVIEISNANSQFLGIDGVAGGVRVE